MPRLSHADQQCVLDALRELYAQTELEALREMMVLVTTRLVPCEVGSYNEISRTETRPIISIRVPDVSEAQKHYPAFCAYFSEHPITRHNHDTGAHDARKLSDFVTASQLGRLRIYNEYYRQIGVRHQMVFWFDRGGPIQRAVSLTRAQRDFSERDRAVLDLLRPHYAQAYDNALGLARARIALNALERAHDASAQAMLVIDRFGRAQWLSAQARGWLKEFFATDVNEDAPLPEPLTRWLGAVRETRATADLLAGPSWPFRLAGPAGVLVVRVAAEDNDGSTSLLFTLERSSSAVAPLRLPGLTRRENEVLGWIAQGKSNPEIALILGLSVRTVYKHVENIFAKLGVENRAAAMLRALEAGARDAGERGHGLSNASAQRAHA